MSTVAERAPGRVAERTGGRRRLGMARLLVPTLAWIAAIGFFFPVFWMFLTGFKQEADAFTSPPKLFFAPTLEQYRQIFARDFAPFLINSASATVVSTLLVLALAIPCAYGLAVKPVEKWRDVLFFFISTRFLPVVGAIVPIYVIARDAHLLDTVTALIILYTAMNMPIAVWMLRSFFMEVPKAIMEAARIDGASLRQELIRIVLPLVAPTFLLLVFRDTIASLQDNFAPALLVTKGGPHYATLFLPLKIYYDAFQNFRFGYGAAMIWVLYGVTAVIVFAQYATTRRWSEAAYE
jgi:sorbitol/mannitol transport system permease protein